MSIKVANDISRIDWDKSVGNENIFVSYDFLRCYQDYHNNFEHVYVIGNGNKFYGHLFNVKISDISDYSRHFLFKILLHFFLVHNYLLSIIKKHYLSKYIFCQSSK